MNRADSRTTNMLGALSLVLADGVGRELSSLTDFCESDWAALIALDHLPGITVDRLSDIVGLSQPGAVRMINRLVDEGRVERLVGVDRRARPLRLTAEGQRTVRAMMLGREKVLSQALDALDASERQVLGALIEKMLGTLVHTDKEADIACRLCDRHACPGESCPITTACGA